MSLPFSSQQIIKITPVPTKDVLDIVLQSLYTPVLIDSFGFAFYVQADVSDYYCIRWEYESGGGTQSCVLYKVVNDTETQLDSWSLGTSGMFRSDIHIHCEPGDIWVDQFYWSTKVKTRRLESTDTTYSSGFCGVLVGTNPYIENTASSGYMRSVIVMANDATEEPVTISLEGEATISPAGTVGSVTKDGAVDFQGAATLAAAANVQATVLFGAADCEGTATMSPTGTLSDVSIDVNSYRFASAALDTTEPQTWLAAADTYIGVADTETVRLRLLLKNNTSLQSAPFRFKVQVRSIAPDGTISSWVDYDNAASWLLRQDITRSTDKGLRFGQPIIDSVSTTAVYGNGGLYYDTDSRTAYACLSSVQNSKDDTAIYKYTDFDVIASAPSTPNVTRVASFTTLRGIVFTTFVKCSNGDILMFALSNGTSPYYVRYVRSTDDGATWGSPQTVNDAVSTTSTSLTTTLDAFVNSSDGKIHVVFQESMITSSNNGSTWDASWTSMPTIISAYAFMNIVQGATTASLPIMYVYDGDVYATAYVSGSWNSSWVKIAPAKATTGAEISSLFQVKHQSLCAAVDDDGDVCFFGLARITSSYHQVRFTAAKYYPSSNTWSTYRYNTMGTIEDLYNGYNQTTRVSYIPYENAQMLHFDPTTKQMLIVVTHRDVEHIYSDTDEFQRMQVYNVDFDVDISVTSPVITAVGDPIYVESAYAVGTSLVVDDEWMMFALAQYSDISSDFYNHNYAAQFMLLKYKDLWMGAGNSTTQQLGSGTYITGTNHGFFSGGEYPEVNGRWGCRGIPAGQEFEVETTITPDFDILESNTQYQLRIVEPSAESRFWNYSNTSDYDVVQSTHAFPTDWDSTPADQGTNDWTVTSAGVLTGTDSIKSGALADNSDVSILDAYRNYGDIKGTFSMLVHQGGSTRYNDLTISDDSGVAFNLWQTYVPPLDVMFIGVNVSFDGGVGSRLRFVDSFNRGINDSYPWSFNKFKFTPGEGSTYTQNTIDYSFTNNVHATVYKDVTSALLAGTATLSATPSGPAIHTAAATLQGASTLSAAATIVGTVNGTWSRNAFAYISVAALVGNTKTASVSLSGEASIAPTGTTGTFEMTAFRWRNNDGSETSATWKAATNVNPIVQLDTLCRLRMGFTNTAAATTELNPLGLMMSVNGGAWETAETISGEVSCVKPTYEVDVSLDVDGLNGETIVFNPMLHDDSSGRWHLFYCSKTSGNAYMRYRRSINEGVSWANYQVITHPQDGVSDIIYHVASRLIEQNNGDLHFFCQTQSGNGILVSTSTNGGTSWSSFATAVQYTFGIAYWDVINDSSDTMWLSFQVLTDSYWEYTWSGCSVSTDGTGWTSPRAAIGDTVYKTDRLGMVSYFDDSHTGIRADIGHAYVSDRMRVERYKWDGATDGDFPYEENGEVNWEVWSNSYNFTNNYWCFGIATPSNTLGHDTPRIEWIHASRYTDGFRRSTSINQTYTMQDDSFPVHWDAIPVRYKAPAGNDTLNQTIYLNGEQVAHFMLGNEPMMAFMNYTGALDLYFSPDLPNMYGTTFIGYPITHLVNSNKVYCSYTNSTNYTEIKMAHLTVADLSGIDFWDNGANTTQQITSGTYITNNFGLSMLGTAGQMMRAIPKNSYIELEFFLKLNSAAITEGDTICFKVNAADSTSVGYPCLEVIPTKVSLNGVATLSATGFTDSSKVTLNGIATISGTAMREVYARSALQGIASLAGNGRVTKAFLADMNAVAQMNAAALCSKDGASSLVGIATLESEALSVVKGKSSITAVALITGAIPTIDVTCKVDLVGNSYLSPHGVRSTTAKTSLVGVARLGRFGTVISQVDELPVCMYIYKRESEVVVYKESTLEVGREETLIINKIDDEVIISNESLKELILYRQP